MQPDESRESPLAIRNEYAARGVESYYREAGNDYRNPHEPQVQRCIQLAVREWCLDLSRVLDLAAGSGEATLALRQLGALQIDGIDPFTAQAYERRTGQKAGRETFAQIAAGGLADRHYSLIVCSFALHLVELSRLPLLAIQLSRIGDQLLVITPHKRPAIRADWGWQLVNERLVRRVRARLYRNASREG